MRYVLVLTVLVALSGALAAAQVAPAPPPAPALAPTPEPDAVPPVPPVPEVAPAPMVAQVAPAPPVPPVPPVPPMPAMPAIADWSGSYLGVGVQEIDPDRAKELKLSDTHGVEVTMVVDDSPAAKAGLKDGDVILEYNGQRVEGEEQFVRLVHETPASRPAKMLVSRNGSTLSVTATIAKRSHVYQLDPQFEQRMKKLGEDMRRQFGPGSRFNQDIQRQFGPGSKFENDMKKMGEEMARQYGENSEFQREMQKLQQDLGRMQLDIRTHDMPEGVFALRAGRLGIEGEKLNAQLGEFFGVKEGVLVRSVENDSPAAKAGIKAGDVITKIGTTAITRPSEIRGALSAATSGKPVPVTVVRNKQQTVMNVTVEAPHSRVLRGRSVSLPQSEE